jgi:hypothetical protein
MSAFTITNIGSGETLGDYEAASPEAALEAMALDAGYAGYQEMCDMVPADTDELIVEPMKCQCGRITGERCGHTLEIGDTVEITHVPEYLRASLEAAGGYPLRGAARLRVARYCIAASDLVDGEWSIVVADPVC